MQLYSRSFYPIGMEISKIYFACLVYFDTLEKTLCSSVMKIKTNGTGY